MFCERCGLHFLPKQSVCTRCGVASTRHWLQLMGLLMLMVAVACNSLVGLFLLPRLATGDQARLLFRAWLWFDHKASLYGWVAVAAGLLAWDFFVWRASRPKIKGWLTRKLLTVVLVAGVTPIIPIPWWVPAGQPPQGFFAAIGKYPGLPSLLAWGLVLLVATLICTNAETRDSLLGHGRVLSLIGLGVLLLVLAMTVVGWALA